MKQQHKFPAHVMLPTKAKSCVKAVTTPPPPRTLSENDWNFDKTRVPDAEVKVCCYWEYARESAFVQSVRERCHKMAGWGLPFKARWEIVGEDFDRIEKSLGRAAHLFQERIYVLGGTTAYKDVVSPFPESWQSLDEKMRGILLETATWSPDKVMEMPAFRWSSVAQAVALAKRCEAQFPSRAQPATNEEYLKQIKNQKVGESWEEFLWSNKPRTNRPSLRYSDGMEVLLVEIEWGRFTKEQILECFRKWVRVHGPKDVKAPSGQGHKTKDLRVALQRLGVMRALHVYTFAHPLFPDSLKDRGEKACYEARVEAKKTFQKLFPFLKKNENPLHWDSKGGKAKVLTK